MEHEDDDGIEIECPTCGALCSEHPDGSYTPVDPAEQLRAENKRLRAALIDVIVYEWRRSVDASDEERIDALTESFGLAQQASEGEKKP